MTMKKRVVVAGGGEAPKFADGAKASVHFTARILGQPELVDDSRDLLAGAAFELRIGKGFVISSWEDAVKTMLLGERATFEIEYDACKGYSQLAVVLRRKHRDANKSDHSHSTGGCSCARGASAEDADLHTIAGQTLEFEFELTSVEEPGAFERQSWEITLQEKAESLPKLKEAGNALFKQQKYAEAQEKYFVALGYLESIEMKGMATDSNVVVDNDMKLVLLLNYAACALKLRDYPAAVKYTTMVLEADPRNVKALFRRGQAHLNRGRDLDLAKVDLDAAAGLAPQNTGIQTALAEYDKALAASKAKDANMFKGMF